MEKDFFHALRQEKAQKERKNITIRTCHDLSAHHKQSDACVELSVQEKRGIDPKDSKLKFITIPTDLCESFQLVNQEVLVLKELFQATPKENNQAATVCQAAIDEANNC